MFLVHFGCTIGLSVFLSKLHFSQQQWELIFSSYSRKESTFTKMTFTKMMKNSLNFNRFGLHLLKTLSLVCPWIRTFDLQLAGDGGLSLGVLGSTGVHAAIKAAGLTNLQGANALIWDLTVLGVVADDHLIFQPLNFRLKVGDEKYS